MAFFITKYNLNRIFVAVTIVIAMSFCTILVSDDALASEDVRAQFHKTFQLMLEDPSDVDMTMKYANLAIQLGDYEAAIPALERILLFNPDLPRVKQEVGVLYYRLDAFDMAKTYLEEAISSENVPQDVLVLANEYLKKIN